MVIASQIPLQAGHKEGRKESTSRKPSRIRYHRHEVLSIEQDNVSDMGHVRKNLWNKRCPSDDAQSEESGGVLVVPAVAAVKSSSRNYHDYNFSSEEEVEDLSNVSCRKGKMGGRFLTSWIRIVTTTIYQWSQRTRSPILHGFFARTKC
jgi:hypothetical protein